MTPLLSVRDLHVGFGRDPRASEVVRGVSFDIEAGQTLAIVGESGSGKSVTALSLNRLVDFGGGRITAGSITLRRSLRFMDTAARGAIATGLGRGFRRSASPSPR
jgi:ABC-type glutathione transport system ATPase component